MNPPILAGGRGDRNRVAAVLARAFAEDPAFTYIFPDANRRQKSLRRLFPLLFDSDARAGMCLVSPDREGVTLWRGPGRATTGWREMLSQALPLVAALGTAMPRALRVAEAIEAHFPAEPFWYLHVAGVDPAVQGRGLGTSMVRAGLQRIAGQAMPVYLETATEHNTTFYRGIGFRVTGEWEVPKGGPRFWSMLYE